VHRTRLIVALVFLPIFFLFIKFLPPIFFLLMVLTLVVLSQYEFYRFFFTESFPPGAYLGLIFGFLFPVLFYWNPNLSGLFPMVLILFPLLIFQLFFFRNIQKVLGETALIFFGIIYIGYLLGHLVLLRGISQGELMILFILLVTWAGDSGGYYIGSFWGNKKLYERVSPGKTIAGGIGGLLFSVIATFIGKYFFLPILSLLDCLVLGILLGIIGQLGDLTESLFKRSAGKKDSGDLIPGHGGVLDKMDSFLFTTPAFYYYLILIKGYGRGSGVF